MATPTEAAHEKDRLLRRLFWTASALTSVSVAWGESALATDDEVRAAVEAGIAAAHSDNARRSAPTSPPEPARTTPAARSDALTALLRAAGHRHAA